ncbi:MAG: UbiH/UbiF family hydroxylase [Xanthobacteraceae bacterium]
MERITAEIAVIGAGPAGLAAAVALAASGASVALIGKPASDTRTTALLASSVTALETLGVWQLCHPHAAPLQVMRIVDDTGRLWRATELRFSADEIGLEAFGWNIENRHLVAALANAIATIPNITCVDQRATAVEIGEDAVTVTVDGGHREIHAQLVIGGDGRRSPCRTAAGIAVSGRDYPQTAITLNFAHTRPHQNVSTEFHTPFGPFTLVPLPGQRSSLVCVVSPAEGEALAALNDAALADEIERRSHSILGRVSLEGERGTFPLRIETATRFAADRIALVGDAAHVLPPIGAQGFNLGLRDIATIAELVAQARRDGHDVGARAVTDAYHHSRQADAKSRTLAADMLNRTLLSDFLPMQGVRGLGLYLIDRVGPLRRALMREGVAPMASMPKLMRGEAI